MPAKTGSTKKGSSKRPARGSGPREKIKKMYGKREPAGSSKGGQFSEMDNIGLSLAVDRRQKAKKTVKPGYGDQGDQPVRKTSKKSGAKKGSKKGSSKKR
jgi:hypothetical protein